MARTLGGLVAFLSLVVGVFAWLVPDPLSINEDTTPQPGVTTPQAGAGGPQASDQQPAGQLPAGQGAPRDTRPNIDIAPESGPPGTSVTVSGTGFPASAEVDVTFHLEKVGEARPDANGRFKITVRIPASVPAKDFPWAITASSGAYHDREAFKVT